MESSDSQQNHSSQTSGELAGQKRELPQSREYLHSILQNSDDMIFALDREGKILSFSRGGEKVLGYSCEEITGHFIKHGGEKSVITESTKLEDRRFGTKITMRYDL